MGISSLIIGILTSISVCISLIPLLNILNCISLPLGLIGLILGIAAIVSHHAKNGIAIAGIILNGIALLVGTTRVVISLVTTGGII